MNDLFTCLAVMEKAGYGRGRQRGRQIAFLCPCHADKTPSLFIDPGKNCWHCQACSEGGNPWELAAFINKKNYQRDKSAVNQWLKEYGLLNGGPKQYKQQDLPLRGQSWYPELLKSLSLKETMLISTVLYYIRLNQSKYGKDFWNCSFKKLRENFLPNVFSETTLYLTIRKLQKLGILTAFTNHHTAEWRIHIETLCNFLSLENVGFQNERIASIFDNCPHHDVVSDPPRRQHPVENSTEKEKKEALVTINSIPIVVIPDNEKVTVQNENLFVQNEKNPLSKSELAAIRKYSNEPEKDAEIFSKFKQTFGGNLTNFRLPDSNKKPPDENSLPNYCYACGCTEFYGGGVCVRCHPPVGVKR